MHLVKGVSAFLRRGSPGHSRGDGSDGSGERSNVPSWPDIQFRNEGDEAFLGSLWQDYQEALGLATTSHSTDIGMGRLVLIQNSEIVTCDIITTYSVRLRVSTGLRIDLSVNCARFGASRIVVVFRCMFADFAM